MRKWAWRLVALAVVAAVGMGAAAWTLRGRALDPYQGFSSPEQFVDVPSGVGPRAIAARLVAAGVVRDDLTFRVALWLTGRARELKAGEYRFTGAQSAVQVVETLANGAIFTRPVTFREGLTIAEMADVYASNGLGDARRVSRGRRRRRRHPRSRCRGHRPRGLPLPRHVCRAAAGRRRHAGRPDGARLSRGAHARSDRARRRRWSHLRQVVTLASLVEKETAQDDGAADRRRRVPQPSTASACRCRPTRR